VIGTAVAELTPRLPIWVDPNGIPARVAPLEVDDVDVGVDDVGLDDAAMLLEPDPHIPDSPDVASIPEVMDIPDVADVDVPEEVDVLPGIAALAGIVVPAAIPPPSYVVGDPNVPNGEVPTVEHAAPLLVFGTVIVPVMPLGTVLPAGAATSGNPFGPIDSVGPTPSEDVTPSEGIAVAIPAWANAGPLANKSQAATTISNGLMENSPSNFRRIAQRLAGTAAAEPAEAMTLFFIATAHKG
jgi:hypothetical protein